MNKTQSDIDCYRITDQIGEEKEKLMIDDVHEGCGNGNNAVATAVA